MLRLIFVICLAWLCLEVSGQEVTRSTDIVVLRGKSYYLHTVLSGQTLYSICRVYGTSVEEVKALNGKKDDVLSLYEVLRIPYVEPFVQQDEKYYYHRVQQGETMYSIARLYHIAPKKLLKLNSEYEDRPLSVGAVVKLPLNEIVRQEPDAAETDGTGTVVAENGKRSSRKQEQKIEKERLAEKKVVRDTLPVPAYEQRSDEEMVIPESPLSADALVKVALVLPFSAGDYPLYQDTVKLQPGGLSSRSEMFVGFYEGILLAVDSLKNLGYRIDLHVFDSERKSENVYWISEEINRLHPDLIIGPVYASIYRAMSDQLSDKSIPLVYPLSSRSENLAEYPNFIQVNASFSVLAEQMLDWLDERKEESNILYINLLGLEDSDVEEKKRFGRQVAALDGVHDFGWEMEQNPLDTLRTLLSSDQENIIVLPVAKEAEVSKVLPLLSALTDGYQITVLGLPEWQTFSSIDHETFFKLNTKLFTHSYVDYQSNEAKDMAAKYRKYFYTEPGTLVFKAFDMGIYFIELVAKYRGHALDALKNYRRTVGCTKFYFRQMSEELGKENYGFYIVNFSSDYQLKIERPQK